MMYWYSPQLHGLIQGGKHYHVLFLVVNLDQTDSVGSIWLDMIDQDASIDCFPFNRSARKRKLSS